MKAYRIRRTSQLLSLYLVGAWALAASNIREGTRVLLVTEVTTDALIPIVSVVVLARLSTCAAPNDNGLDFSVFTVPTGTGVSAMFLGVVFGFLSFTGFEAAATLGEVLADPSYRAAAAAVTGQTERTNSPDEAPRLLPDRIPEAGLPPVTSTSRSRDAAAVTSTTLCRKRSTGYAFAVSKGVRLSSTGDREYTGGILPFRLGEGRTKANPATGMEIGTQGDWCRRAINCNVPFHCFLAKSGSRA